MVFYVRTAFMYVRLRQIHFCDVFLIFNLMLDTCFRDSGLGASGGSMDSGSNMERGKYRRSGYKNETVFSRLISYVSGVFIDKCILHLFSLIYRNVF